jgi:signal transduction histidine kinase
VIGWLVAFGLALAVVRLRRRLELVARAEHELRGPLTAFGLAVESARRGRWVAEALDAELARARVALADLTAARRGRRFAAMRRRFDLERLARSAASAWGARVEWRAGGGAVVGDEGRVAQALGNLLANAAEHGGGGAVLRAHRSPRGVELVVVNEERGRGLAIAAAAARDAGGALAVERGSGEFTARIELAAGPAVDAAQATLWPEPLRCELAVAP